MKEFFDEELISGMQQELRKYAADEASPDLAKAAECLHAALEILEEQGKHAQADQLLQVLQKIGQTRKTAAFTMPSIEVLMREGLTKHDLIESGKGDMRALAKFSLVLRRLGLSEHEIKRILGHKGAMPEQTAKDFLDPNRSLSNISDWIQDPTKPMSNDPLEQRPEEESEFLRRWKKDPSSTVFPKKEETEDVSIKNLTAQKKSDFHTKGLTPEKMVENLKHHGTEFNMSQDSNVFHVPPKKSKLEKDDVDPELAGLLDLESFDIDASDDELMGIEIQDDSLDVFDKDIPLADFEDERD